MRVPRSYASKAGSMSGTGVLVKSRYEYVIHNGLKMETPLDVLDDSGHQFSVTPKDIVKLDEKDVEGDVKAEGIVEALLNEVPLGMNSELDPGWYVLDDVAGSRYAGPFGVRSDAYAVLGKMTDRKGFSVYHVSDSGLVGYPA